MISLDNLLSSILWDNRILKVNNIKVDINQLFNNFTN